MKKILIIMGLFTAFLYFWFAILPESFGFSFPTGGWDWLNFIGFVASMAIAAWGVMETIKKNAIVAKEQAVMSVKPCLDIAFPKQSTNSFDGIYRKLNIDIAYIHNNGYNLIQRGSPPPFTDGIITSVRNIGFSTAINVTTTLHDLISVDGIDNLDDIQKTNIDDFYNKIHIQENICFFESGQEKTGLFHLAPPYNLNNNGDEFYMIFDVADVKTFKHLVFKFQFDDVYNTDYTQYLYFYIDKNDFSFLPISGPLLKV